MTKIWEASEAVRDEHCRQGYPVPIPGGLAIALARAVIETLREPGNDEWNAKLDAILSEGDSKADRCPHGVPVSETCTMCRVDAGEIGFT